jgi:hypothetical protein
MAATIIQMWLTKAGTAKEIAQVHGVTGKTVFNVLERSGVRPRKRYPKRGPFKANPRPAKVKVKPILGVTPVVKPKAAPAAKPGLFARLWAAIKG